ncbi:MAG: ABC transporter permease [Rubrobacter sp.]|nr:ABC transporter permease [Rubrobacter sp.]
MADFLGYLVQRWDHLLGLTIEHAQVVLISLIIATAIGMLIGVLVYRNDGATSAALNVTSVFVTIPSFALFGLLVPVMGIGAQPTIFALSMYALLPIVRNTTAGLRGVDPAVVESAEGMGMSARQRLLRIEMPLAWPVILSGIRVSALLIMGIAAIAAIVNGPGLGNDIFAGLSRVGTAQALNLVLSATLGIVVLALIFDGLIALLGRITTPGGIK